MATVTVEAVNEREEEELNEEEARATQSTQGTSDTSNTDTTDTSDVFNGGLGLVERIEPYVDFSQFYSNVEAARQNGTLPESLR